MCCTSMKTSNSDGVSTLKKRRSIYVSTTVNVSEKLNLLIIQHLWINYASIRQYTSIYVTALQ